MTVDIADFLPEPPRRLTLADINAARAYLARTSPNLLTGSLRLELHRTPRAMVAWWELMRGDDSAPTRYALEVLGGVDRWPWNEGGRRR